MNRSDGRIAITTRAASAIGRARSQPFAAECPAAVSGPAAGENEARFAHIEPTVDGGFARV